MGSHDSKAEATEKKQESRFIGGDEINNKDVSHIFRSIGLWN